MRRFALISVATMAVVSLLQGLPLSSPTAAAEVTVPQVVVPTTQRWAPRVADVLGAGSSGFVFLREKNPGLNDNGGGAEIAWKPYNLGAEIPLPISLDVDVLVRDDWVLTVSRDIWPVQLTLRHMPDPTPTALSIPEGYRFETATADGLLLRSDAVGDGGLYLKSWASDTLVPIEGFPGVGAEYAASGQGVSDASGAIVMAIDPHGPVAPHYIDTATATAWPLPAAGMNTVGWSLGGDTIAWQQDPASEWTTPPVIATVPRPTADAPPPAAPATRPVPAVMANSANPWSLQPFGTDVLVAEILGPTNYGRAGDYPILAVAPGGATRAVLDWAHGGKVTPGGDHLVAVAGDQPEAAFIVRVSSAGFPSPLVQLAPVAARTVGVAIDGQRLVIVDDSGHQGGVADRPITRGATTVTVGARRQLASDVLQGVGYCSYMLRCEVVTAGGGSTMFLRDNYPTYPKWVAYAGTTAVASPVMPPYTVHLLATDGRWGLATSNTPGPDQLLDSTAGTITSLDGAGFDISGGVLYGPASDSAPLAVTARTLATGARTTVAVPAACGHAHEVQAAGRWLLVMCDNNQLVLDRRGVVAPWWQPPTLGATFRLGDGFLLRSMPVPNEDPLIMAWVDLYDAQHSWRALGDHFNNPGSIAVDRSGKSQTVAWVSPDRRTHVAALPARSSTGPALRLNGPTAPVTLADSLRVTWSGSDPSGIASYSLRYRSSYRGRPFGGYAYPRAYQRTGATSASLALSRGHSYCYSVSAIDKFKNQSPWTTERCTTTAVDDRSLARSSSGVLRGTSDRYFAHTYSRMASSYHRLTVTGVAARQITVVARTCPTCGAVGVYLDGRLIGKVSLYSSTSRYRVLKSLSATSLRSGTLVLKSTTSRASYIDGVALRR